MLLPRPACDETAVLILRDSEGSAPHICLSLWAFGVARPPQPPHYPPHPHPPPVVSSLLSAAEEDPDVRGGSCSAQQGNGLLRLRRVRADEPADTHGQTDRQAERPRDRQERGEGATACFGSLDPLRIEPSPLLFAHSTPTHLSPALHGGEAEHGGAAPGCFSRCLYG